MDRRTGGRTDRQTFSHKVCHAVLPTVPASLSKDVEKYQFCYATGFFEGKYIIASYVQINVKVIIWLTPYTGWCNVLLWL